MRARRWISVVAGVVALSSPTVAHARGGGGSHGFHGGGSSHSGGSHGSSGGFGHGIGGFGHGFGFGFGSGFGAGGGGLLPLLVLVAVVLLILWLRSRRRKAAQTAGLNTVSDRTAHRSDTQARERAAQVGARVDAIADTDATFDRAALERRAVWLYTTAQRAWTARDHATLQQILSPVLYGKWADELRDYESRGEVNVVEILSGPVVELVDVANRAGEVNDTVTFRITATLNDVVRRTWGGDSLRKDGSTSPVEYWTLRKNPVGEWIVSSVEQAAEGAHHLTSAIETDGWDQKEVAREAVLEVAGRSAARGAGDLLSLTNISWSTDADAAVGDLSVLDGRFDRSVLEVAVERFLEEWVMNDGSLDFTSVRTAHRTVMRDAVITSVKVHSLVSRDPIVFRVTVDAEGVYYEVDRRTEQVLRGDARKRRPLTFAFGLRLDDTSAGAWSVVAAHAE
ncbi:Tim44 domain-containing protein [Streptacidiphilus jiangxiensis]|uniref:Predicted lipid-binding transport protein, Tim44 family n=1 Tax=Streptacidiphilus jiangxiensis TaxID=235985 RepID=A0A1H7V2A0_STRJI|nr:Tim44-like domain-containing protein [Streptacidiphilus jiangxiensis]SEM02827.1 Predicted lipid-binding transport protein, Tim44 family [Streptacidiphilus jiangxiensis]